jgi:hypothetical protein
MTDTNAYFFCNEYRMKNFVKLCSQQLAGDSPPTKAHIMRCQLEKNDYKKNCDFEIHEYIYIPYIEGIDSTLIDRYNILLSRKLTYYYYTERDRRNYIEIIDEEEKEEEDEEKEEEDVEMEEEELNPIRTIEDIFDDDRPVFKYLGYKQILELYEKKQLEYYDLSLNLLKELDLLVEKINSENINYIRVKNSTKTLNLMDIMRYRFLISNELQTEKKRLNDIILELDINKPTKKKKFFNLTITIFIIITIVISYFIITAKRKKRS